MEVRGEQVENNIENGKKKSTIKFKRKKKQKRIKFLNFFVTDLFSSSKLTVK